MNHEMRIYLKNTLLALMLLAGALVHGQSDENAVKEIYYEASKQKILGNYQKAADLFNDVLKKDQDNAGAMYELAGIYRMQDKIEDALELAGKAVSIEPENEWYKILLVELYQEKRDYHSAAKILNNLIERHPENIEYYSDLASNYLYDGEFKKALDIYEELEDLIGINEQISLQKQKIYLQMDKPEEAIEEIERLVNAYPDETRYLEMLAEMYMANRDFEKALGLYERIRELDPDNPYINISLSDYYRKVGNKEKSLEYLRDGFANPELDIDTKVQILLAYYSVNEIYGDLKEEAFELAEILVGAHPGNPKAHSIYADLLFQDEQYEKARESFRKVISIDSSKYLVWEQLLFTESELGDFKAIAGESARAIDLFPQQPLPYLFSGVANVQLDNTERAIEDLQTGAGLVVDNDRLLAQFYAYLGDAYHMTGNNEKAYETYEKALDNDPANTIVLNNYAYFLSLEGKDLEKAEAMAREANELDPGNGANQDTYGWVLYKLGRYAEAKEWIGKALENDRESSAEVLEHYGDVLYKLGEVRDAVRYWEKARDAQGEPSEHLDKKIRDKKLYE